MNLAEPNNWYLKPNQVTWKSTVQVISFAMQSALTLFPIAVHLAPSKRMNHNKG